MRVALHAVSIATLLIPRASIAQEPALSTTALLAVESWSGTFWATFADTATSQSGEVQILVRSVRGTVRFGNRRARGTTEASWSGAGTGNWRVDDRVTTPSPRGSEITQTWKGQDRAALDERRTSLRIDTGRNTYDLTLTLEPFQVDLATVGGALDEPITARTRPRRGGGLGGSVRASELTAGRRDLDGQTTLRDGTVFRWHLSQGNVVQTVEQAEVPTETDEDARALSAADSAVATDSTLPQMQMNRLGRGESGVAWFYDRWERSYPVAEIEVIPPEREKDFSGLDHTLVIKFMNEDGAWTTVAEVGVKPDPTSTPAGWEKHHPVALNPDYFQIRFVKTLDEPVTAQGIRFELQGEHVLGGGWTFWVRSAPQPEVIGQSRYEWRYTHVW